MKIAHFQVSCAVADACMTAITARLEHVRGVMGAVAVRSMGLLSVLYDEHRTDPVKLADEVAGATAAVDPEGVATPASPWAARARRRRTHGRAATALRGPVRAL